MMNQVIEDVVRNANWLVPRFAYDDRLTTAVISDYAGRELARGYAHRKPSDPPCRSVGETLAYSRALAGLSDYYWRLAIGLDAVNSLEVD